MEAITSKAIGVSKQTVIMKKEEMDDHHEMLGGSISNGDVFNCMKKKKGSHNNGTSGAGSASSMRCCQADKCSADLSDAKQYHHRHKVCELHAKAQAVVVAGTHQRFCQQCSRFHELSEFDEAKRSCRRRLAGHNERRRKNSAEFHTEASSSRKGTTHQLKELVCSQVDDRGRIQITIQDNANYKHFQIR